VITLEDVDPTTPFVDQLQESAAPVVLVNTFLAPEGASRRSSPPGRRMPRS
jgi:hypothetical protein